MRYLFCSLDTHGFIYPAIGIALQLIKRGHEVAFVTSPVFKDTLSAIGIERIPRGIEDGNSFQTKLCTHPHETVRQVQHIQYALKKFNPHVLVGQQLALGPLLAARWHNLPVAVIGQAAYLWPKNQTTSQDEPQSELDQRSIEVHTAMMAAYNAALQMYKLPETAVTTYASSPLLGDAFLLRSVPELEQNVSSLPARVHFVGDCLWEPKQAQPNSALLHWLAETKALGQPLLYVQPGRVHNGISFWVNLMTALRGKPIRVAASVGRIGEAIGDIPTNFFVDQHVPQSTILPHASGVICSSTTTAVLGAITNALPLLLIITGDGEQPHIHDRCQQAGVSLNLDLFDATPENLEYMVNLLLNKPYLQQNAYKLQQSFAHMQQKQHAIHVIEQLIPTQQVSRHTYSSVILGV